MAKIFTHDCKKCKTETEHTVQMQPYNLHVVCKTCGTHDDVPLTNSEAGTKSDSHSSPHISFSDNGKSS